MTDKTETRYCYYVPETQDPAIHGGYVPSLVNENESGHYPMTGGEDQAPWVWGSTIDEAREVADHYNSTHLGIDKKEAARIICSSMFAS